MRCNVSFGWRLVAAAGWCAAAASPVAAHDGYQGLTSPTGESCCSERDCEAVSLKRDLVSGGVEVAIDGEERVPVDASALLAVPSPDGKAHACYSRLQIFGARGLKIRCVILPEGW